MKRVMLSKNLVLLSSFLLIITKYYLVRLMFFLDTVLSQFYASFIRPHLDYEIITYDQHNNEKFSKTVKAWSIMLILQ